MGTLQVYTIGHSTRSVSELIALLQASSVDLLVDVRSFPHSRRNPQFNVEALPPALEQSGVAYRHIRALGGRRDPASPGELSPNEGWREPAFRNYADYALTPAFRAGLDSLIDAARQRRSAIMCAEAQWSHCHRRIITDYLLATGADVFHIAGTARVEPASLTPGAQPQRDGTILYPPEQQRLL